MSHYLSMGFLDKHSEIWGGDYRKENVVNEESDDDDDDDDDEKEEDDNGSENENRKGKTLTGTCTVVA